MDRETTLSPEDTEKANTILSDEDFMLLIKEYGSPTPSSFTLEEQEFEKYVPQLECAS